MELYNAINELQNNESDCIIDETMLPLENLQLGDDGDVDNVLTDTLLTLVDSDGVLLKNKLMIPETIEDLMDELLCEESFHMLPECEFLAYSLSRDYFKNPITAKELSELKNIIRIKSNEKERLAKLTAGSKKRKKIKINGIKYESKKTIIDFN